MGEWEERELCTNKAPVANEQINQHKTSGKKKKLLMKMKNMKIMRSEVEKRKEPKSNGAGYRWTAAGLGAALLV